jgi:hypothetical protein
MPGEEYQPSFNDMWGFLNLSGMAKNPSNKVHGHYFLVVWNFRIEIDITCIIVTNFISTVRRQLQKATYRIERKTY